MKKDDSITIGNDIYLVDKIGRVYITLKVFSVKNGKLISEGYYYQQPKEFWIDEKGGENL